MSKKRPRDAGCGEDAVSSGKLALHHLASWQGDSGDAAEAAHNKVENPLYKHYPGMHFLNPDEKVQGCIILNDSNLGTRPAALSDGCVRGNACRYIYWEPSNVKAALVTCGGLCPGLNSIIRGVTNCLWNDYGVRNVVGITAGYNGLVCPGKYAPVHLDPGVVREIHMKGGSILKAGRGGFDAEKICNTMECLGINMLFVIGGDGTQFAGHLLYEAARKRNLPVSILGVPKSIDNDVLYIDRTFGFHSAVGSAAEVLRNGWVEATSCERGVGIVKLMGRDAGFVAVHAALASNLVDLVMIPEVKEGARSHVIHLCHVDIEAVLAHVDATLDRKGHMVIAVAEGAGQEHVATGAKDSTGHTIYGDIGIFLRDKLNSHLKPSGGRTFYIDPSYIIRSVPIAANDHIYCSRLANDAVHSAMRGYTGVCVGAIHNIICMLPSKLIASGKKQVRIGSSEWRSCVENCSMPAALAGFIAQ